MILFLGSLTLVYVLLTGLLLYYWKVIPEVRIDADTPQELISIIIPVRNEEENIGDLLADIEAQNYPKHLLEVIIIDDGSTDATVAVAKLAKLSLPLVIIPKKASHILSHKKAAITQGAAMVKGAYIVTTDGDCRVPADWIASINQLYQNTGCKFISGLVAFRDEDNFFSKIQSIEFVSLIGTGAASISAGFPNMCNGANLSFKKSAFYDVEGYGGFENIQSGDDEFLMHKIHLAYPGQLAVLKNKNSVVTTYAKENFEEFFNQRKRWASKWPYYQLPSIKVLAFFIFLFNASLIGGMVNSIFNPSFAVVFGVCILLKCLIDYFLLNQVLSFMKKTLKIKHFIIASIFYPFYVSFFAVCSNIGGYSWKGRNSNAKSDN